MAGGVVRVVVGALVRDESVLLTLRSADKLAFPGVWDLPGGVVEQGESQLDALVRELREELGVEVVRGSTVRLCQVTVHPADEPVLLGAWLVREWHGTPTNVATEEHDDIGWFSRRELPPLADDRVRRALVSV